MGQAALDLPDPLAKPPAPASPNAASADDLLSQLAGEEIDRMLAEADGAPAATADVLDHPQHAETVVKVFAPGGEVKQATVPAEPIDYTEAASATGAESHAPLTGADRTAIDQILSAQAPAAQEPEKKAVAIAAQVEDAGTSTAERTALEGVTAALNEHDGRAQQPTPQAIIAPVERASLPFYLKPLQWISLPLMLFPVGVRELVGKIAILTLFNAIAVIIYVMLFRH
jgi:hypothetical protein